ncbi:hypothetical protein [Mesorhizobium sp. CO1-1-8]|uniref:hypothetical protein n=1 Tax=Mesorhizobium sp. CO1-1-8 TaxID=2876631 RepID=UPI001CD08E47|nr:hypothetical protein [Mesorhizobium sp. CO1-1-8]MBZ9775031.1 hypothetical protein [Mesorhizobium sp. CO1-1-8]
MADLKVAVLLSAGVHPVSAKSRMAPGDARALEMALKLTSRPVALHAGNASNDALRDYLGMGVERIHVLGPCGEGDDVVPVLASEMANIDPDIVLTGMSADAGEASGMVPYLVARRLGMKHISSVAAVEAIERGEAILVQAYKGSARRRMAVQLPVLISASELAPAPRARAFAKARRGILEPVIVETQRDEEAAGWMRTTARRRPKKIFAGQATGSGVPFVDLTPDEAAQRILDFLKDKNIIGGKGQ